MLRSSLSIAVVWVLVCALIYWAFDALILRQHNPNQMQIGMTQQADLILKRSRDGHFRMSATLNGEPVVLLIDTGASVLTIDQSLAKQLSLPEGAQLMTQTANGEVAAYESKLDTLIFGPFQMREVKVAVVRKLGNEVLLGMNVLRRFSVQIAGDEMKLQLLKEGR
ncbi:clan AA aspartic protease [Chitinibacter fontanus]|uniref:Clan AA aspartic protease n=1 Tax=Chitinibacter fontanus TaxID=1737446 RepID=A0A7D5ZJS5_9NEIS|nr:retropepsin-like aspartic protease [Chitinibacter fontanus]QLI83027.1 clan AA aspartic protease [Chitinibacter fontanus]